MDLPVQTHWDMWTANFGAMDVNMDMGVPQDYPGGFAPIWSWDGYHDGFLEE